jgi:hypothetical protein
VKGPIRAGKHDAAIMTKFGLLNRIAESTPGQRLVCDKAYIGLHHSTITPFRDPATQFEIDFNVEVDRVRAVTENANQRINVFDVLKHQWRADISKHGLAFYFAAALATASMRSGHPLRFLPPH